MKSFVFCFLALGWILIGAKVYGLSSPPSHISFIHDDTSLQTWPSSLPLPHVCQDKETAHRAREAMAGPHPTALEGRLQVNLDENVRFLHVDPPVLVVEDFLTPQECKDVLQLTTVQPPPDAGRVIQMSSRSYGNEEDLSKNTRESTTWYVRYACAAAAPLLRGIVNLLPQICIDQIEEVQLVRYAGSLQGFGWHQDALEPEYATPSHGGQRIATCLVYLDECDDGRTLFRDLVGENHDRLAISPKVGRALLFFPSATGKTTLGEAATIVDYPEQTFGERNKYDNTRADHRTFHAGEPPTGVGSQREKHIAQLWIHSSPHTPVVFGGGLNRHAEANL